MVSAWALIAFTSAGAPEARLPDIGAHDRAVVGEPPAPRLVGEETAPVMAEPDPLTEPVIAGGACGLPFTVPLPEQGQHGEQLLGDLRSGADVDGVGHRQLGGVGHRRAALGRRASRRAPYAQPSAPSDVRTMRAQAETMHPR